MSSGNLHIEYDVSPTAPRANWHEHDPSGHVVQFYNDDEFLVDALGRFIGAALGAGDAAIVVATGPHREALARRLQCRGLDLPAAARHGRYIALDAQETLSKFMVNGAPDAARFKTVMGEVIAEAKAGVGASDRRVAVFGEMVALLWADGRPEAALRLEELWNALAETHAFSLRCAYPMSAFDRGEHGGLLLEVCAAHSSVIPSESYSSLVSDDERLRNITYLQQRARALESETVERQKIQKSLRLREEELADFLENAVEGVQQLGPDRTILWANRAMLQLLGYTAAEYVGHKFGEFHVTPEAFEAYWQKPMRGEDIYDYPAQLRCKDGSVKQVVIQSNGVWEDGHFVRSRCFLHDVTDQKRMEGELRDSEARLRSTQKELEQVVEDRTSALRRLSGRLLTLQDTERRRIARELHDGLGQYLAAANINLGVVLRTEGFSGHDSLEEAQALVERAVAEMRTLSYLLHPPLIDEAGLTSAARWYVEGFSQRSGVQVNLKIEGVDRLPEATELALFRILQEALTNVHRHSGASAAEIRIQRSEGQVILEVKDHGSGIPADLLDRFNKVGLGMGVGLTGIKERVRELGGELKIRSNGDGTSVRVCVPIGAEFVPPMPATSPAAAPA